MGKADGGPLNLPWRILFSGGLAVGGPQTHVTHLCRVLREAGAEVTIAAASTNWTAEAMVELKEMGVRLVVSPFGFGAWRLLGKIWCFLAWPFCLRRDHDVLYCIGAGKMHLWASFFVKKGGCKMYHEIVECPPPGSPAGQVAARMDALVANSRAVQEEMARAFPGIPLRTLPFLTARAAMPGPSRPRFEGGKVLRVAYLGRLVSHKRPDRLVESWPVWNTPGVLGPARLDLYGGDYYNDVQKQLQAVITKYGLEDTVRLRGAYAPADLARIFDDTDLVVLPSIYEGLPLVLVEAMQRGIPVVATSAGGTAELGDDNPDVIVTPGTDWEKFEAGMREMVARLRSGQIDPVRLHRWTESRYGFETVAAAWRKALLQPDDFFGDLSSEAMVE